MADKKSTPDPAPSTTPPLGMLLMVAGIPHDLNNGIDTAPAIITRVWSDTCVNVKIFTDGHEDLWRTSIPLFEGAGHYETAREEAFAAGASTFLGAYWI